MSDIKSYLPSQPRQRSPPTHRAPSQRAGERNSRESVEPLVQQELALLLLEPCHELADAPRDALLVRLERGRGEPARPRAPPQEVHVRVLDSDHRDPRVGEHAPHLVCARASETSGQIWGGRKRGGERTYVGLWGRRICRGVLAWQKACGRRASLDLDVSGRSNQKGGSQI